MYQHGISRQQTDRSKKRRQIGGGGCEERERDGGKTVDLQVKSSSCFTLIVIA